MCSVSTEMFNLNEMQKSCLGDGVSSYEGCLHMGVYHLGYRGSTCQRCPAICGSIHSFVVTVCLVCLCSFYLSRSVLLFFYSYM